jgi:hypothetical protein
VTDKIDAYLMIDIRAAITAALIAEHYRRAALKIEASPEEHCAGMAKAVMRVLCLAEDEDDSSD